MKRRPCTRLFFDFGGKKKQQIKREMRWTRIPVYTAFCSPASIITLDSVHTGSYDDGISRFFPPSNRAFYFDSVYHQRSACTLVEAGHVLTGSKDKPCLKILDVFLFFFARALRSCLSPPPMECGGSQGWATCDVPRVPAIVKERPRRGERACWRRCRGLRIFTRACCPFHV